MPMPTHTLASEAAEREEAARKKKEAARRERQEAERMRKEKEAVERDLEEMRAKLKSKANSATPQRNREAQLAKAQEAQLAAWKRRALEGAK